MRLERPGTREIVRNLLGKQIIRLHSVASLIEGIDELGV